MSHPFARDGNGYLKDKVHEIKQHEGREGRVEEGRRVKNGKYW